MVIARSNVALGAMAVAGTVVPAAAVAIPAAAVMAVLVMCQQTATRSLRPVTRMAYQLAGVRIAKVRLASVVTVMVDNDAVDAIRLAATTAEQHYLPIPSIPAPDRPVETFITGIL